MNLGVKGLKAFPTGHMKTSQPCASTESVLPIAGYFSIQH